MTQLDESAWASPNLLMTRERIAEIQAALQTGDPVLTDAYNELIAVADRAMDETPDPIHGAMRAPGFYTARREEQRAVAWPLRRDGRLAHALALACVLSGNPEYGAKAREFIFAWVDNMTHPEHGNSWWWVFLLQHRGDTPIIIAYSFPLYIYAFDLLRGEGLLSQEDQARFREWLRRYVDYHRREELYKNNHHNWQVLFLLTSAHALQDEALFHRAVRYYHNGIRGQIRGDGALPRELWRGKRSGTYTLMALEGMVQAVHIAEGHGIDHLRNLKSRRGGTLRDAVRFYTEYLGDPDTWRTHTNADELNVPETIADWGWVFELPARWWGEEPFRPYLAKRPYGFEEPRVYTMEFATLHFYITPEND